MGMRKTRLELGWHGLGIMYFIVVYLGPITSVYCRQFYPRGGVQCLQRSNSSSDTMNRLKRLAAVLLNPTEDPEQTHAALEAAGVPVSFADCRNCPNPCEDGK
jgi:hypothetical protein